MDFSAREARVFYSHCEASVLQRAELPQKLQCHAFSIETPITESNILKFFYPHCFPTAPGYSPNSSMGNIIVAATGEKGYKKRMSKSRTEVLAITHSPLSSAVRTGLEPATPGVTGLYSNRLNYRTKFF